MAFPMAGDADCGPANPMAGLMKQFQQDRSLQQERFTSDQRAESSKARFRTAAGHPEVMADTQFANDFMKDGMVREQHMFKLNGLERELELIQHGPPTSSQQPHASEWSGDFMEHQQQFGVEAHFDEFESVYQQTQPIAGPSVQQQQHHHQDQSSPIVHQHHLPHQQERFIPQQNWHHQGFGLHHSGPMAITHQENAAFEHAFDAAKQDTQVDWEKEFAAQEDWASEFAQKEGMTEEATDNDALSRTAAMLLDSVDVNDNPKFKNSQFMSLMQKLRDRAVHVEGDKLVETDTKQGNWSSEFNRQTHQDAPPQQRQQQGDAATRDWVDDFIPNVGSTESGNMWTNDFAKHMERGWAESSMSEQQNWSERFQQQSTDMSQEEMQRLYGRGTEMNDWVEQYQQNIAHLKTAKDTDWDNMQKDWDKFKDEQGTGYRAVNPDYDTYNFTLSNPYLLDHASIDGVQHNSLTDSILALEAKAQLETNNAEAWQALGLRQQENERDAAAIAALRKAVSLKPELLEGWLALAVSYTNENCRADAYDSLEQWIANNPSYQHLAQRDAGKMSDQDRHSYITNLFLEAARSSPGDEMDANVQVGLGVLFNVSEEYEKAIDCFKAALTSRPQDYLLWNKLGATLANSKDSSGAIEAYFNALEINPSYVRARYNLAISCINLGQHKEAAEHLLTALALQQQDDMGHSATSTAAPLLDQNGQPVSVPSGMSENVWDSLRMVMFMMKREDLGKQCERRNLDIFRAEFDF